MAEEVIVPPVPLPLVLDSMLLEWLREDVGRGDQTTQALSTASRCRQKGAARWVAKQKGVVAGLPIAARLFHLLDSQVVFTAEVAEGQACEVGQVIATLHGPFNALLVGERVALNIAMRLSGIATMTRQYSAQIADLPTRLVDTRKTIPGMRILEKYASRVGGAMNHRLGLDDAVMLKDNHIAAAGGIGPAIALVRQNCPYPLTIEVEVESLVMVEAALEHHADIIMLDNMSLDLMRTAVQMIRQKNAQTKIEASGNVTIETIRAIAETGVDYISSSAPITRSPWLDLSMKMDSVPQSP